MEPKYQPHLDGLRAVAVLAVLGFHAFPELVPGGFAGVDVFFVLSGFLISTILYAEFGASRSSGIRVLALFYARRIRRIFPALILVLAACSVLGLALLLPGEFVQLSRQIVASAAFYQNLLLAGRTGYFDSDAKSNPLLHLWSLGVEEQFYLLWPLVIWLAVRCRIRLLPLVVFCAFLSFFWNGQRFEGTGASAFYLPQMRMWELLLGAILALLCPLGSRRSGGPAAAANGFAFLGLLLMGAGFWVMRGDMDLPNRWTLLPTIGAACVIGSGGAAWINRRLLAARPLVWIGLISYPLYLWHWPLLAFTRIGSDGPSPPIVRAALLGGSVILAGLTYWWVERPIRQGRALPRSAAALAAAMALIAGIGCTFAAKKGFPSRFPPLINEISSYKYDAATAVRQGTYFLIGDQDETNFKRDPNEIKAGRPTLYLWGDSHAAALYPGLNAVYGKKYNIVQRTTAKTPPLLPGYFNPGNARQINQYVLDSIRRDRPEFVLLDANWPGYDWVRVEDTITALQALGIRHIVLVGPVPAWIVGLPQQLYNYVRKHRGAPVPVRMNAGVDPAPPILDRQMAALAARRGIEYLSPCSIMGNQDGFLVRTGATADTLTTFDAGHLTASGSTYLASHFPDF